MREFLEDSKSPDELNPYFIINTTGRHGAKFSGTSINMENSVFEVTPWGCHSQLLSTNKCPDDLRINSPNSLKYTDFDLSRVVTISGAAVDGQMQTLDIAGRREKELSVFNKSWLDILLDITHLNMGYFVSNDATPRFHQYLHKILPFPLYLLHDRYLGENATSIYLSDGGHSENLGIYPLIRRGVQEIYVVDAEADPNSVFEAPKRLNQTLAKYGLRIDMKIIPPVSVKSANTSVLKGKIVNIDQANKFPAPDITLHYIKLSLPSNHSVLPLASRLYANDHNNFPHETTADVFYSPNQFQGKRSPPPAFSRQRGHLGLHFSGRDAHAPRGG